MWRCIILLVALKTGALFALELDDPDAARFEKLSGRELVKLLAGDAEERTRAFYELSRRKKSEGLESFGTFREKHRQSQTVVCPQPGEKDDPIYLFLHKGSWVQDDNAGDHELFPDFGIGGVKIERPVIVSYNSEGKQIRPFAGNNVLDGTFSDLNRNGTIERAEVTRYGIDGIDHVNVLEISEVREKERLLFAVLLDWGEEEWDYRLVDPDGDGICTVEAGPISADGIDPKARWTWDGTKYVGPKGSGAEHFVVLDPEENGIWKHLNRLREEGLKFPEPLSEIEKPKPQLPPVAAGDVYAYKSLKDASDAQLYEFMGDGKNAHTREYEAILKNHLPKGFWTQDPKSAAMALLKSHRSTEAAAEYQLAIDDRGDVHPPEECTVEFTNQSARCYTAVDTHYFLRVDKKLSYLAYARSSEGGVVFYNLVHNQPAFNLRLCGLDYEVARQISDVLWWLDRARTKSRDGDGYPSSWMSSTADGSGKLIMRGSDDVLLEHSETLWASYLSERWGGAMEAESVLNFASYLLEDALPKKIGREWEHFEPKHAQNIFARDGAVPRYEPGEKSAIREMSLQFLQWQAEGNGRISRPIAVEAAKVLSAFTDETPAPAMKKILADLPPPGPPKRSFDEVWQELEELEEITDPFVEKGKFTPDQIAAAKVREEALQEEREAIAEDFAPDSVESLRSAVSLALRKIATANNARRTFHLGTRWRSPGLAVGTAAIEESRPETL